MSRQPLTRVLDELDTDADLDELLSLGERSAQEKSGALYAPLPHPAARMEGLGHTSEVEVYFHPGTGAFLTLPVDE